MSLVKTNDLELKRKKYKKLYFFVKSSDIKIALNLGYFERLSGNLVSINKLDVIIPRLNQIHVYLQILSIVNNIVTDITERNYYFNANTLNLLPNKILILAIKSDLMQIQIEDLIKLIEDTNLISKLRLIKNRLFTRFQKIPEKIFLHKNLKFWIQDNPFKMEKTSLQVLKKSRHELIIIKQGQKKDLFFLPNVSIIGSGPVGMLSSIIAYHAGFDIEMILEMRNTKYTRKQIVLLEDPIMSALIGWEIQKKLMNPVSEGGIETEGLFYFEKNERRGIIQLSLLEQELSNFLISDLQIPLYYNTKYENTSESQLRIFSQESEKFLNMPLSKLIIVTAGSGTAGNKVRETFGISTITRSKKAYVIISFFDTPKNADIADIKITDNTIRKTETLLSGKIDKSRGFKNKTLSYVGVSIDSEFNSIMTDIKTDDEKKWRQILNQIIIAHAPRHKIDPKKFKLRKKETTIIEIEINSLEKFYKILPNSDTVVVFIGDVAGNPHFFSASGINTAANIMKDLAELLMNFHFVSQFGVPALEKFNTNVTQKINLMMEQSFQYVDKINSIKSMKKFDLLIQHVYKNMEHIGISHHLFQHRQ